MKQTVRILLIEDNPGDAFLIKFYLEQSTTISYNLIHTELLSSALDLLSKNEFDIILLDLKLPDSDGLKTLEEIQKNIEDSVVIVLTGLTDEELGKSTLKAGAQDFLVKGQFDGKVLNSSIRFAFERKLLLKEIKLLKSENNNNGIFLSILRKNTGITFFKYNKEKNHLKFFPEKPEHFKLLEEEKPYNLYHFLKQVPEEHRKDVEKFFNKTMEKNKEGILSIKFSGNKKEHTLLATADEKNKNVIRACIM